MVLLFGELSTATLNVGLAWMTGTFFAHIWLGNCQAGWCDSARRRLHCSALAAAALCMLGSVGALWVEAAVMNDSSLLDARDVLWTMFTMTHYGRTGLCALVILLVLASACVARNGLQRRRVHDGLIAALLLAFAYARANMSHAAINGFGWNLSVEWLHLLLISLWAGTVMVSGWIVLPCATVQKTVAPASAAFLHALSRTALLAVAGIAATGAYNALRGLGSVDNFSASAYGQVLAIKLCLVAIAVGLGAFNRLIGFPAVAVSTAADSVNAQAMQRLIFVLRLESLVLLGALIAAAVLTNTAPPALS